MAKTYDMKCLAIAQMFLADFPALTEAQRADYGHRMACDIQEAIEDFIAYEQIGVENDVNEAVK